MLPLKTIEDLIKKHTSLEKELSSGEVDKKLFAEKSKEYSELNDIIKNAKKFISYEKDKLDLEKIIEDPKSDEDFKALRGKTSDTTSSPVVISGLLSTLATRPDKQIKIRHIKLFKTTLIDHAVFNSLMRSRFFCMMYCSVATLANTSKK